MSSFVSADDSVVDDVTINIPTSCSIEGIGMNTHNANIINGTYQADIGTTTLKAFCNDSNGFAIYANGYTGNVLGNNKLIGSSTNEEIITGTATSTPNPDISNWAMKLATSSSATYPLTLDNGFGSYSNVPSSYKKVAHRDSGTDLGTSAEGATLTSTYAAYISKTQPADSYIGQVIYTLVHPASEEPELEPINCTPSNICYYVNSNNVEGQMGKQEVAPNSLITLYASNYKRDGYGFSGWNDKYDYSGNYYGPNQDITAPSDVETNGLSLYAVWIKSDGILQNWGGCNSLAQGATTALTDERDGNTYAVAKLADDKCWMIENLRLDNIPEFNSSNTHNPALPLMNDYASNTTSNHLSEAIDLSTTFWCNYTNASCIDQSLLNTDNITGFRTNIYSIQSEDIYSYGNYYNWYSATAGNGKYSSVSTNVSGDICPKGWHLPTGSSSGDFGLLNTLINGGSGTKSDGLRSYPSNFIYSGTVSGGSVYSRNFSGSYWSATVSGNNRNYASDLGFNDHYASTNAHNKYYGGSVRCVSDK